MNKQALPTVQALKTSNRENKMLVRNEKPYVVTLEQYLKIVKDTPSITEPNHVELMRACIEFNEMSFEQQHKQTYSFFDMSVQWSVFIDGGLVCIENDLMNTKYRLLDQSDSVIKVVSQVL